MGTLICLFFPPLFYCPVTQLLTSRWPPWVNFKTSEMELEGLASGAAPRGAIPAATSGDWGFNPLREPCVLRLGEVQTDGHDR